LEIQLDVVSTFCIGFACLKPAALGCNYFEVFAFGRTTFGQNLRIQKKKEKKTEKSLLHRFRSPARANYGDFTSR
jgi:hypothetical protein